MTRLIAAGALLCALFLSTVSIGAKQADNRLPIYIRNLSDVSSEKVQTALPAFQAALSDDFAPLWGQDARLVFIGDQQAPKDAWVITLLTRDDTFCLCYGFHDFHGRPYAVVYTEGTEKGGWQVTFTHELFEMAADPYVNRAAVSPRGVYIVEVGDPVEANKYAYTRPGADGKPVRISDFVTPAWYRPDGKGPYDFRQFTAAPFAVLDDGYVCQWLAGGWSCG